MKTYISKKGIELFKSNKVKLQTLACGIIIASTLVGCSKNDTNKKYEKLENAIVITTVDGEKNIVKKIVKANCRDVNNTNHFHYIDLVTGNYYSDSEACISVDYTSNFTTEFPTYLDIESTEPIYYYLTSDEITKIINNEFCDEDFVNLAIRIKELSNEEVKSK